jgi:hypothetical protein
MDIMNRACIMKMGWELQQGSRELWSKVIRGKYGRGAANFPTTVAKPSDSSFWKALASFLPRLEENSCRVIGKD